MVENTNFALCKVVLVGESGVGKTCINIRFIEDKYEENQVPTSAASFTTKTMIYEQCYGKVVKFEIWDTAGQEQYRSIGKIFYKGARAIILVYAITDKNSFDGIKDYWYEQIKQYAPKNANKFYF